VAPVELNSVIKVSSLGSKDTVTPELLVTTTDRTINATLDDDVPEDTLALGNAKYLLLAVKVDVAYSLE